MFPIELEQLEAAAGRKLPTMPSGDEVGGILLGKEIGTPCPLLVMGRCTAYEHRPLICRTFGSVEGMRCEHGCRPDKLLGNVSHLFDKVSSL
jgi:Fe-S-cluster containining protein